MEYTNDFGLRDSSDSESEEARPESPASESGAGSAPKPGLESDAGSSPDSARCRCSEQRGRCIHCRLEQFRAEQVRASAQAALLNAEALKLFAETAQEQGKALVKLVQMLEARQNRHVIRCVNERGTPVWQARARRTKASINCFVFLFFKN